MHCELLGKKDIKSIDYTTKTTPPYLPGDINSLPKTQSIVQDKVRVYLIVHTQENGEPLALLVQVVLEDLRLHDL